MLLASTDVHRPAAILQLRAPRRAAGDRRCTRRARTSRPLHIAREALAEARARRLYDVLIVDTAGRLHVDDEMMARGARTQRAAAPDRDAVRRRQHGRPGRGERRARVRRGAEPDRRRADQGRRRCARRRGAVGAADHRPADPVHGHRREDRRAGGVPARARGLAHPRHGRRAVAGREGHAAGRPRAGREARPQARRRARTSTSRTCTTSCGRSSRWAAWRR